MTATRTRKPKAAPKAPDAEPDKGGRPTKRTPETEEIILSGIRTGLHPVTAAKIAGISRATFDRWRKDEPGFEQAIEAAEAAFERQNLGYVTKWGSRSWKASAWALERRFPDRWGAKLAVGGTGEPVKVHVVRDAPGAAGEAPADDV